MYTKIVKIIGICLNYREIIHNIPLYKRIIFPSIREKIKLNRIQIKSSIKSIENDNLSISDIGFTMEILYANKDKFKLSDYGIMFIEEPKLHMVISDNGELFNIGFLTSPCPICRISINGTNKPDIILSKDTIDNEYIQLFKKKIIRAFLDYIDKK